MILKRLAIKIIDLNDNQTNIAIIIANKIVTSKQYFN